MIGALLLGLVAGAIGRMLMPRDAFRGMSGPKSWGVSILLGLAGAALGWVIFTWALGIGDEDIFDWGGILSAIIGVLILLPIVTWILVERRETRRSRPRSRPPPRDHLRALSHRRTRNRSLSSLEAQAGANLPRTMSYAPAEDRYERMAYNRCSRCGLLLPPVSLGLWHNFGGDRPFGDEPGNHPTSVRPRHHPLRPREQLRPAVRLRRGDVRSPAATTWLPTATSWSSRRRPATTCGRARTGVGLAQVPPGQPRPEPPAPRARLRRHLLLAPLRPRDAARGDDGRLDSAVRQGKALYVGISSYSARETVKAAAILHSLGTPLLIHQPLVLAPEPLDRGRTTRRAGRRGHRLHLLLAPGSGHADRQVPGRDPEGSRASRESSLSPDLLTPETLAKIRALNDIAAERGQSLAQMALAWTLRDPRVTSTLVGASSVAQLEMNVAALDRLDFTAEELAEIDRYATESGIDLWASSASRTGEGPDGSETTRARSASVP